AEDALKAAHGEILAQRTRIGELLGRRRGRRVLAPGERATGRERAEQHPREDHRAATHQLCSPSRTHRFPSRLPGHAGAGTPADDAVRGHGVRTPDLRHARVRPIGPRPIGPGRAFDPASPTRICGSRCAGCRPGPAAASDGEAADALPPPDAGAQEAAGTLADLLEHVDSGVLTGHQ
ncbi:hypothetical protein AB0I84_50570, partial [Streptomyces spectabilis]